MIALGAKGGLHAVSDMSHIESRFTALENQLKGLTIQQPQVFESATITCFHCKSPDHTLSACPYYAHQLSIGTEQVLTSSLETLLSSHIKHLGYLLPLLSTSNHLLAIMRLIKDLTI